MSYRPITYCKSCGEPFDVYRAPEDRICDSCLETMGEDADECDHEEYELDILTGRASCTMCDHRWFMSAKELERDQERREAADKEQRYWDRVNEGYLRAKDGER